jgi:hypothetical protein
MDGGDFWYKFYNIEQLKLQKILYKLTRGRDMFLCPADLGHKSQISHSRLSYNYIIIIFVMSLCYLSSTPLLLAPPKV